MEEERGGLGIKTKREKKKKGEGARFNKKFVFKKRDEKALKWIAEQGVGTVDQLWWAAWKNEESKGPKYAEDRLREMAKGGYLKRERVFGSGVTNYIITQKGRHRVDEAHPDRKDFLPPVPKRVNDGQYRHTMALNWCRLFLERDNPLQDWMSDRAIQSWLKRKDKTGHDRVWIDAIHKISPDASFQYLGERWLFEYEATQKNQTKYEEKARVIPWSKNEAIRGVIFVAANLRLKATLAKYFQHRECHLFSLDELKEGVVTAFLKRVHDKQQEEEKESARYFEEKRKEKLEKLPQLQVKLEELERSQKALETEIEISYKAFRTASEAYSKFKESFIKLPGQKDSLIKKQEEAHQLLNDLESKKWNLSRDIIQCKSEIKILDRS